MVLEVLYVACKIASLTNWLSDQTSYSKAYFLLALALKLLFHIKKKHLSISTQTMSIFTHLQFTVNKRGFTLSKTVLNNLICKTIHMFRGQKGNLFLEKEAPYLHYYKIKLSPTN